MFMTNIEHFNSYIDLGYFHLKKKNIFFSQNTEFSHKVFRTLEMHVLRKGID